MTTDQADTGQAASRAEPQSDAYHESAAAQFDYIAHERLQAAAPHVRFTSSNASSRTEGMRGPRIISPDSNANLKNTTVE